MIIDSYLCSVLTTPLSAIRGDCFGACGICECQLQLSCCDCTAIILCDFVASTVSLTLSIYRVRGLSSSVGTRVGGSGGDVVDATTARLGVEEGPGEPANEEQARQGREGDDRE